MHSRLNKDNQFFENYKSFKKPKKYPTSPNDILQHLIRTNNDQQFNFVFEFEGKIDDKLLGKAFRFTLDIEPVLDVDL